MRAKLGILTAVILMFVALNQAPTVWAANFVVNSTADSGAGSLREAIGFANANPDADTISFSLASGSTITLGSGLTISQPVVISGPGIGAVVVNANGFTINVSSTAVIAGLSLGGGNPTVTVLTGGNLTLSSVLVALSATNGVANSAALNVTNSTISGSVGGAGILNNATGTLTMSSSTIALSAGAGLSNTGTASIVNSTISSNFGAGIANSGAGTVPVLRNVTLSGNATNIANTGGAISAQNTLISTASGTNCSGALTSAGNNLSSDASCNLSQASDLSSTNASLNPLADNGCLPTPGCSVTFTHALNAGSPAIDRGNNAACSLTDQRGGPRTDGDANGTVTCDIGAYEAPAGTGGGGGGNPGAVATIDLVGATAATCAQVLTYTATVKDGNGVLVAPTSVTFTSLGGNVSPTSVMTVNGVATTQFTATSLGTGMGRVTATIGSVSDYVDVYVTCGGTYTGGSCGYTGTGGGYTTVTGFASAGTTLLQVASNLGFNIGDSVIINPLAATQETRQISNLGSLIFSTPLTYNHNPGEYVYSTNLAAYGSNYGTNCYNPYATGYNPYATTGGYYDAATLAAQAAAFAAQYASTALTSTTTTTSSASQMAQLAAQVAAQNAAAAAARPATTTTTTTTTAPVVIPPNTGTGIRPPNTGDAGLAAD